MNQQLQQVFKPEQLLNELQTLRPRCWDTTINTESVQAINNNGELNIAMPNKERTGDEAYKLNHWAHTQFADKLDIPWKYYHKLLKHNRTDLLVENINGWIDTVDNRTFRMVGDTIRAVVSERYRAFDHLDLYKLAILEIQKNNAKIYECSLTETRMYVKALLPHTELEIVENDAVIPGIILSNSEVGAGKTKVEPFLLRKVCSNGMIGQHSFGRIHVGGKRDLGVIDFSDKVESLQNDLDKQIVKETIESAFDPNIYEGWVNSIKEGVDFIISRRADAVEAMSKKFLFSKDEENDILNFFAEEKDANQWTLANSITRLARDKNTNYDRKVELERIGADIAVIPNASLKTILKTKQMQEELEKE